MLAEQRLDLVSNRNRGHELPARCPRELGGGECGGQVVRRMKALAAHHQDVHEVEVAHAGAVEERGAVGRALTAADQRGPFRAAEFVGKGPHGKDRLVTEGADRATKGIEDEDLQIGQVVLLDLLEAPAGGPLRKLLERLQVRRFVRCAALGHLLRQRVEAGVIPLRDRTASTGGNVQRDALEDVATLHARVWKGLARRAGDRGPGGDAFPLSVQARPGIEMSTRPPSVLPRLTTLHS